MNWTKIDDNTEAAEVWQRDARGQRVGDRPFGCLVRTFHRDGETLVSVPVLHHGVTLDELRLAGHA